MQVQAQDGMIEVVCVNAFDAEEEGELSVQVNERYWSRGIADDGYVCPTRCSISEQVCRRLIGSL